MGTRTIRMNNNGEMMLETLALLVGDGNINKTILNAIQYQYNNDRRIQDMQEEFKKGFLIHVGNYVAEEHIEIIKVITERIFKLVDVMVIDNSSNIVSELVNVGKMAEEYLEELCSGETELEKDEDKDQIIRINRMEAMVQDLIAKGICNTEDIGANLIKQICELVKPTPEGVAFMLLQAQMGENRITL